MLQYRFVYDNFREKGKTKMNLTKQFFKYVSQNIFGLLGTSCYILADTYFISQAAGTDGVTLLNLCLPIYNFIFAIGSMIGLGAATAFQSNSNIRHLKSIKCYFISQNNLLL